MSDIKNAAPIAAPKERTFYLDFLRVMAAVAVISIHTFGVGYYRSEIRSHMHIGWVLLDSMVRWAVPIFLMISGSLFLRPEKKVPLKTLYGKYILRLAVALVFWNAVYAVFQGETTKERINLLIYGKYHMWYMYVIICLYMLLPIIRAIAMNKKVVEYYLVFFAVITGVVPIAQKVLIHFGIEIKETSSDFSLVLGYAGYMLLGYYLASFELGFKLRRALYVLGALSVFGTFAATTLLEYKSGGYFEYFFGDSTINVMISAAALFLAAKKFFEKRSQKKPSVLRRTISFVSKHSFGVYLVHVLVLELILDRLTINWAWPISIVISFALIITVTLVSLLVSWAISKIPFVNKYIV